MYDADDVDHPRQYLKPQSRWRNKKNGETYYVEKLVINATNAQNGESMVLYYASGSLSNGCWYVRQIDEFLEKFYYDE